MANIQIADLNPPGYDSKLHSASYELLSNSEFMNDLSEEELNIQGGLIYFFSPFCIPVSQEYNEFVQHVQYLRQELRKNNKS
ncbi:hypothetical protein [Nostoc sp. CCY 9925]|uniref:hypothetical protein n=1 Tax=Nostoc sp. CCY 9925 TaxID=3103865 RepID=UPI0039C73A25